MKKQLFVLLAIIMGFILTACNSNPPDSKNTDIPPTKSNASEIDGGDTESSKPEKDKKDGTDEQMSSGISPEEMATIIAGSSDQYTANYDGTKMSVFHNFEGIEQAVRDIQQDSGLVEIWEEAKSTSIEEYNTMRKLMDAGGCEEIPLVFSVRDGLGGAVVLTIENGEVVYDLSNPEGNVVGTDLFEQIYVPFAKGENRTGFSDVKALLDELDYTYSCVDPTDKTVGEIKVPSGDDYVYFSFLERMPSSQTIMIVSYYQASSNSEVSLSNYSTDGDRAYDQLKVHTIGQEDKVVSTVGEQRDFLFGA